MAEVSSIRFTQVNELCALDPTVIKNDVLKRLENTCKCIKNKHEEIKQKVQCLVKGYLLIEKDAAKSFFSAECKKNSIAIRYDKNFTQGENKKVSKLLEIQGPNKYRILVKSKAALNNYSICEMKIWQELNGAPFILPLECVEAYEKTTKLGTRIKKLAFYTLYQNIGKASFKILKDESLVPKEQKPKIFLQIAIALHEMHKRGLVHRDVKGDNILLAKKDGQLTAYLSDFGFAVKKSEHTNYIAGTGLWYAAEQVTRCQQQCDLDYEKIDIWQLGLFMYQLIEDGPRAVYLCPNKKMEIEGNVPWWGFPEGLAKFNVKNMQLPDPIKKPNESDSEFALRVLVRKTLSLSAENRPTAEEIMREIVKIYPDLKNQLP